MRWKQSRRPRFAAAARSRRRCALTQLGPQPLEERLVLATMLPAGFSETTVATGISTPTAMDFSPDGRLWVLEQGSPQSASAPGKVKLVHSDGTTFTALTKTVDSQGERGMLGIAFDPNFTSNHFAYLYFTNASAGGAAWATGEHNQLSRFTVDDTNPAQPVFTNEAPILDWNNLSSATNHNGGAIHFGKDGMLYADAGDNVQTFVGPDGNTYRVSQSLNTLLGKQLRIDVSKFNSGAATRDDVTVGHLIPSDNPFVGTATGINQLIYVLGVRNPFTFAVQPGTGRMLINDVGENNWEEIDDDLAGGNYGWSGGDTDGFGHPPPSSFAVGTYHDPLLAYAHSGTASQATGIAIVGGTFYNPTTVQFPSSYAGMYFYEDLGSGWIRYFNPNTPNNASTPDGNSVGFATGTPGGLRDLKVDSLGNLYYLSGGDGSIRKISYTASQVRGQNLFYNGSKFDGNNVAANAADDGAIAPKSAYLPGSGTATFANVSSYTRGINGIMVDLSGAHGAITAADFTFKVGNNNSPSTWSTAAPTTVTVRTGAGVGGSDRIEILWANGAIQNRWLEVIVRGHDALGGSDANTGLVASDVFFFGNAPADSGSDDMSGFSVTSADEISARNDPHGALNSASISNVNDFNRDGQVTSSDQISARNMATGALNQLSFLVVSAGGPFAPDSSSTAMRWSDAASPLDSAVATAVAARSNAGPSPVVQSAAPPAPGARGSQPGAAPAAASADQSTTQKSPRTEGPGQLSAAGESQIELDDELLDLLAAGRKGT